MPVPTAWLTIVVGAQRAQRAAVRVGREERLPGVAQHEDRAVAPDEHRHRLGTRDERLLRQFLPPAQDVSARRAMLCQRGIRGITGEPLATQ